MWAYEVQGSLSVEAHLEADGALSLRAAHALASSLENRARAEIPDLLELTTHMEPRGQLTQLAEPALDEPQVIRAVQRVVSEASQTFGSVACHQVQVRGSDQGWTVSMHCTLPGEISLARAHQTSFRLESLLRKRVPSIDRVTIHTEPTEGLMAS